MLLLGESEGGEGQGFQPLTKRSSCLCSVYGHLYGKSITCRSISLFLKSIANFDSNLTFALYMLIYGVLLEVFKTRY